MRTGEQEEQGGEIEIDVSGGGGRIGNSKCPTKKSTNGRKDKHVTRQRQLRFRKAASVVAAVAAGPVAIVT